MRKQFSLKIVFVLVVSAILLTALVSHSVWSNPGSSEIAIVEQSFQSAHDYIIWEESGTYYRRTGSTGEVTSGSDDDTLIQYGINQCEANGGSVYVKAGTYTASVTLKDNVTLYIEKAAATISVSIDSGADAWLYDMENDVIKRWVDGSLEWSTEESVCTASFVVDKQGSTVQMKRGTDNEIVASGTDANQIIGWAVGNLTSSRTWKEKIVVKGTFTFDTHVSIDSYTILDLTQAKFIPSASLTTNIFRVYSKNNVEILGGRFVDDPGLEKIRYAIRFQNTENSKIVGTYIYGWDIGLQCITCANITLRDVRIDSCWDKGCSFTGTHFYIFNLEIFNSGGNNVHSLDIHNTWVTHSTFYNSKTYSVCWGGSNNTICHNLFDRTEDAGQTLLNLWTSGQSKYNKISHNTFKNALKGIVEDSGTFGYNEFTHNTFTDVTTPITVSADSNATVESNMGFVTENSGVTRDLANGGWITHALAGTPDYVQLTSLNATYDGTTVGVYWDDVNTNSTHIAIDIYWTNSTTITDSVIDVSWYAEYAP